MHDNRIGLETTYSATLEFCSIRSIGEDHVAADQWTGIVTINPSAVASGRVPADPVIMDGGIGVDTIYSSTASGKISPDDVISDNKVGGLATDSAAHRVVAVPDRKTGKCGHLITTPDVHYRSYLATIDNRILDIVRFPAEGYTVFEVRARRDHYSVSVYSTVDSALYRARICRDMDDTGLSCGWIHDKQNKGKEQ